MNFRIVRPQAGDIEKIRALLLNTISDTFQKEKISATEEIQTELENQMISLERYFNNTEQSAFYLIAKYQDEVIGTIGYGQPNNIILEHIELDSKTVPEIKSVYVAPQYQNKGVGTALLESIKKELINKKVKRFCLDCGYSGSQKYWQKKLGEPQRVLKDYWSDGSHHMVWLMDVKAICEERQ